VGERVVVAGVLGRVVEDLASVCKRSEPFGRVRARVEVGVMLARETPVRATDLARGRVTRDAQQP